MQPTDRALLSQVSAVHRNVVRAAPLPVAGRSDGHALLIADFAHDIAHLQWAASNNVPLSAQLCTVIAASGNLDLLIHARALGCAWDEFTCGAAAKGGHIHILEWMRASFQPTPCPWWNYFPKHATRPLGGTRPPHHRDCCALAAFEGNLKTLKWLRKHSCGWDSKTCDYAVLGEHLPARVSSNLRILQYVRKHGCPWNKTTAACAGHAGNLGILQWMRNQNPPCPWSSRTMRWAAYSGHLHLMQWARENGCRWSVAVCAAAAAGGNIGVLRWLHANGCPWDELTCSNAAQTGSLQLLRWARLHNCPWDGRTIKAADKSGDAAMIEWVRAENCPTEILYSWWAEYDDDDESASDFSDSEMSN